MFQQQAVRGPLEQQKSKQGGGGGGVCCQNCGKPCKGEALRVQNKHFHIKCFVCKGEEGGRGQLRLLPVLVAGGGGRGAPPMSSERTPLCAVTVFQRDGVLTPPSQLRE